MKVTKSQLKGIIQEEIQHVLSEGFFLPAAGAAVGVGLRSAIKKFITHFLMWEFVSGAATRPAMQARSWRRANEETRIFMRDFYKKHGIKIPEDKFQKYIDSQLEVIRKEVLNAVDIHVERISKDLGVQSIGSAAGKVATRVTRKASKK